MPQNSALEIIEITAGGGTKTIATNTQTVNYYIFASAVTLGADCAITDDGGGVEGQTIEIFFDGGVVDINGKNFSFFGYFPTANQAQAGFKAKCINIAGTFKPFIDLNANGTGQVSTNDIADKAVGFTEMADLARGSLIKGDVSNRPVALDVSGDGDTIFGDGADVNAVPIAGDVNVDKTGASSYASQSIENADIKNTAAIEVAKLEPMTDGQVITGNTGAGNVAQIKTLSQDLNIANTGAATIQANSVSPSKATTGLSYDEINVDVSFAAASNTGKFTTIMPTNFTLLSIYGIVTSAIAGTDAGTITPNIGGTPVTGGLITCAASDALNTEYTATTITGNQSGSAGDKLNLVTAKTTAGGTVRVTVRYQKTN